MDIVVVSPKGGETKIALDDRSVLQKVFLNESYVSKVESDLRLINRQWHLCTLCDRSGCLIASSISNRNSLCASFARPPWPRILLRTLTCAPKMQYTNASIDWLIRERPACAKPTAVFAATNYADCKPRHQAQWKKAGFLSCWPTFNPEFIWPWIRGSCFECPMSYHANVRPGRGCDALNLHKVSFLSCFHRLRNLLVLKFGLYMEATSQVICFFLYLCHRGYSVQKTLIQINSFRAARKINEQRTTVIANKHRI